jgi:hypothetical protein
MFRFFFLVVMLLALGLTYARANEMPRFSEATLELCPESFAPYEAEWTVECFLNAIRAWNVGALSELTADPSAFECRSDAPCNEHFAFGPAPWDGAHDDKRPLYDMISGAQVVTVEYIEGDEGLEAVFYPGWSEDAHYPKPELNSANWMNSFFICAIEFQPSLGVWLIADGFCYSDIGDGTTRARQDEEHYVEPLPEPRNASFVVEAERVPRAAAFH